MSRRRPAADALCGTLAALGVRHVFGLPGTQNLDLTEALRRSDLRWVVPSHELAAAFMANGHYRSSGRPGVVTTIPGPGFTWALTGLAEARLDSAAVLCLTGGPPGGAGSGRRLQEIPQARMAAPVVKEIVRIGSADELAAGVEAAYRATTAGEPGPVLVEIADTVWAEACEPTGGAPDRGAAAAAGGAAADPDAVDEVARRLRPARRPLLFAGQGAQAAAGDLEALAEALSAPVLLTTSGRGALPETHPLAVPLDRASRPLERARRLVDAADLVLVLGCRLSHNATLGSRLEIPEGKLVRVDASREVLEESGERGHPASLAVEADVPGLVAALLGRRDAWSGEGGRWPEGVPDDGGDGGVPGEEGADREAAGDGGAGDGAPPGSGDPTVPGVGSAAAFFAALREAMPPEGCLVTDSGLHQMLARRHYRVDAPRTLVVPTDFQSMGYGVPAAVGAALASPDRPVAALVGDGGLRLAAFELATARSLDLDLTVIVFADGHFGLIRRGQLSAFGRGSGVDLPEVDLAGLAASLGVEHEVVGADGRDAREVMDRSLRRGGVRLLEVPLEDPGGLRIEAAAARTREAVRRGLGPDRTARVRDLLRRWTRSRDSK